MFQMRTFHGAIHEFATLKELKEHPLNPIILEKVSFNAEDGTRIRLVYDFESGAFYFTFWDGNSYIPLIDTRDEE